jgi:hypothetical protein
MFASGVAASVGNRNGWQSIARYRSLLPVEPAQLEAIDAIGPREPLINPGFPKISLVTS